ncbi:MAG TPA: RMD1 family protein [Chryseosolibacter sp.]|nr:RMD1 family protein [Chryseosolibacter sp.]
MAEIVKLQALLVSNQIDLKGIKSQVEKKPLADSSSELLYGSGGKYEYYFNYGVIVFSGYQEAEMKDVIKTVEKHLKDPEVAWLRDEFQICVDRGKETSFDFAEVVVGKLDDMVVRVAMLNLAQSVALDHYQKVSEDLLTQVKSFVNQLERTGKLKISRNNMHRFLGKALNTQNDIAENIYIFDAPDIIWENEYLDKLHQGLIKHFDLKVRFSEIEYTLRIIENNLTVFREIIHQRESNLLEFIIILLILVEVFDLFLTKLLNF